MLAYPRFPARRVHDLAGRWRAAVVADDRALEDLDPASLEWDRHLPVPGCFDALPELAGMRGIVAYRTEVQTRFDGAGILRCGGLGLRARIWVDGTELATWDLPYGGFALPVPAGAGPRELVIAVDNRFDAERMPLMQQWYDFYAYGGIYRDLEWHEVGDYAIDRVRVRAVDVAAGKVELDVVCTGEVPDATPVAVAFDGGDEVLHDAVVFADGAATISTEVPSRRAWSPADPHLHVVEVRVGDDAIRERFGLRTVEVRGDAILLNGEPLKLLGYCRHEAHPQYGPALPHAQLVADLQLLRGLGCNFVRGSHYPQDQRFLDCCDEMGFLVFEESLGWGYDAELHARDDFLDANLRQTRLMVRNSFNHPSVILWGFLNEGGSHDPATRRLYESLVACVRDEDPSRPVTYATNRLWGGVGDRHLDLVDVVSLNMYPGWYAQDHSGARPLAEVVPRIRQAIDEVARLGAGDKPLIVSEIGAGAIYGWRDPLMAHWSEEYQRDHLRLVCDEVVANARIAGISLWQFCDSRTYANARALGRPRAFNNKGTFDEYRRPKLAADAVREAFARLKG